MILNYRLQAEKFFSEVTEGKKGLLTDREIKCLFMWCNFYAYVQENNMNFIEKFGTLHLPSLKTNNFYIIFSRNGYCIYLETRIKTECEADVEIFVENNLEKIDKLVNNVSTLEEMLNKKVTIGKGKNSCYLRVTKAFDRRKESEWEKTFDWFAEMSIIFKTFLEEKLIRV